MELAGYEARIEEMIPRFLTYLDRNPYSPSYGCMDRNWWHYKSRAAFPSATFQQGVLILSALYKMGAAGVPPRSAEIVNALFSGIRFWTQIQHRDGSFDEWYPNEHSFVATAFTTYAMSEVLLDKVHLLDSRTWDLACSALKRSGRWLLRHNDLEVSNHQAGKIAALGNLSLLFPDYGFREGAEKGLAILMARQDQEGWYPEYGGADPSYQSVTCDFLAKYHAATGDAQALQSLERGIGFMAWFLHPDGTVGGSYGGRNAQYLMTHGLELVADQIPTAKALLNRAHHVGGKELPWIPKGTDDRYLIFFFLPNLLQAYEARKARESESYGRVIPLEGSRWFERAGIFVISRPRFYFVCNLKKGGACRAYVKQQGRPPRLMTLDGGYFARFGSGEVAASQWLHDGSMKGASRELVQMQDEKFELRTSTPFGRVNRWRSSPGRHVLFLLWTLTLGRIPWFRRFLDRFLKDRLIRRMRRAPLDFERVIQLDQAGFRIIDVIARNHAAVRVSVLGKARDATVIHVPSSRLFSPWDGVEEDAAPADAWTNELNEKGSVKIEKTFSF